MRTKNGYPSARWPLLVSILFASTILASCSATGDEEPENQLGVHEYPNGIVVVIADKPNPEGATDQALLEGMLATSPDGCLVVHSADLPNPVHLILPPDTTTSKDLPLRISAGGQEMGLGDHVAFSGGFNTTKPFRASHAEYPADCGSEEVFVAGRFGS